MMTDKLMVTMYECEEICAVNNTYGIEFVWYFVIGFGFYLISNILESYLKGEYTNGKIPFPSKDGKVGGLGLVSGMRWAFLGLQFYGLYQFVF